MFRNYFKTAWRNLVNNKVYSTLNIMGLAVGMAVAFLIGLWSYNEYTYDRFLPVWIGRLHCGTTHPGNRHTKSVGCFGIATVPDVIQRFYFAGIDQLPGRFSAGPVLFAELVATVFISHYHWARCVFDGSWRSH